MNRPKVYRILEMVMKPREPVVTTIIPSSTRRRRAERHVARLIRHAPPHTKYRLDGTMPNPNHRSHT